MTFRRFDVRTRGVDINSINLPSGLYKKDYSCGSRHTEAKSIFLVLGEWKICVAVTPSEYTLSSIQVFTRLLFANRLEFI